MSGPVSERAMRCRPWSGHWNPVAGLLTIHQFTAQQLLRSGHRWNEWAGTFLNVVHNQAEPLSQSQDYWLRRLIDEYHGESAEVVA